MIQNKKHREGFEQFKRDLASRKFPELADKLVGVLEAEVPFCPKCGSQNLHDPMPAFRFVKCNDCGECIEKEGFWDRIDAALGIKREEGKV